MVNGKTLRRLLLLIGLALAVYGGVDLAELAKGLGGC